MLTVGDLRSFLKNVPDKVEVMCVLDIHGQHIIRPLTSVALISRIDNKTYIELDTRGSFIRNEN